jgi:1,4-dihydroxy-2-naphthoate octaprenyltransferase
MWAAAICFLLAVFCGVPLVLKGGLPILLVGIFSVMMGYAYTAGPFPLAYLGLGEVFVILFFGLVAVMGVYFLHTNGGWGTISFWPGLQVGFHATVLIAINNLRDAKGDREVHKKTLAVRMGKKFSRYEITFFVLAPFVMNAVWWMVGFKKAALLPLLTLPLAVLIIKNIFTTEPSSLYNKFLGQSALLHLLFGILLSIGFVLR